MEEYNRADELRHYGRKGMKWYQSIYGKVRARKTAKKRAENLKKAREAKAANKAAAADRAKKLASNKLPIDQMTTAELTQRIQRLQLEQQYKQLVGNPKNMSRGKRFINSFIDDALIPGAVDGSKRAIADSVADLGKKIMKELDVKTEKTTKNSKDKLKEEVELLELKRKKAIAEDYLDKRKSASKDKDD